MIKNFDELLNAVRNSRKAKVAVAAAEDMDVINVASNCLPLADFIFIGNAKKIEDLFREAGKKVNGEIIDIPDHGEAAGKAVELVKAGKAQNLMKGLLHSSVFLKAILNKETGLNIGKLVSQVSVFETSNGLQLLTDCAVNVKPELNEKKQIIENAVELACGLGVDTPKVAVLAAVEVVNPDMQATVDAALLSVMAQRGQIKNCVIDGPLGFDNAIDPDAARHKGIGGPVAGLADILLAPNLEAGNMLAKSLIFWAKRRVAAAMMGVGVPVIFTSRTESVENKVLTVALASYLALETK